MVLCSVCYIYVYLLQLHRKRPGQQASVSTDRVLLSMQSQMHAPGMPGPCTVGGMLFCWQQHGCTRHATLPTHVPHVRAHGQRVPRECDASVAVAWLAGHLASSCCLLFQGQALKHRRGTLCRKLCAAWRGDCRKAAARGNPTYRGAPAATASGCPVPAARLSHRGELAGRDNNKATARPWPCCRRRVAGRQSLAGFAQQCIRRDVRARPQRAWATALRTQHLPAADRAPPERKEEQADATTAPSPYLCYKQQPTPQIRLVLTDACACACTPVLSVPAYATW